MHRTLMLATALALLSAPAWAGGKSPQTQYNLPDPSHSSMGQPSDMDTGQGAQHDQNLATAPDKRPDSPNGKHLTTKPGGEMSHQPATVPDRRPDSPNGKRLNNTGE